MIQTWFCNNCQSGHAVGEVCDKSKLSEVERDQERLKAIFRKEIVGYGEVTTVILRTLYRKLFNEGLPEENEGA
jgi:hypothetical protein